MPVSKRRSKVTKRSKAAKHGPKAAAAVFALGMSVAGPQALGIALAAPSDDQPSTTDSASAGSRSSGAPSAGARRSESKNASPVQVTPTAGTPKSVDTGSAIDRASIDLAPSSPAAQPVTPAPVTSGSITAVNPLIGSSTKSGSRAPKVTPLGGLIAAFQSLLAGAATTPRRSLGSLFGGPAVTYDPSLNTQAGKVVTGVLDIEAVGGFSLSNTKPKWTPVSSNSRRANSGVTTSQRGGQASVLPQNGTVTLNPDGTFSYVPNEEFARQGGVDTFTVTVTDSRGRTTVVPVTVVVGGNTDPTGATVTLADPDPDGVIAGLIVGDDPEGDPLSYLTNTGPEKGSVLLDEATGEFAYAADPVARHAAAKDGAAPGDLFDTFIVTISDGRGGTVDVPINVPITPFNSIPEATVRSTEPNSDTGTVTGSVVGTDPDGDSLRFTSGTIRTPKGTVTVNADGTYDYTPDDSARHAAARDGAPEEDLVDSFEVTMDDGYGGVVIVEVNVPVLPRNIAPVLNAVPGEPNADTAVVTGAVIGTDADGDALTFSEGTVVTEKGTFIAGPDGTFSYEPSIAARKRALVTGAAEDLTDSFEVTVDDGHGGLTTVAVEVAVLPGNVAPVLAPELGEPGEAGVVTGSAGGSDLDDAAEDLTYSGSLTSSKGTLVVDPDTGALTYTPSPEARHAAARDGAGPEETTDTFTITVADGYGGIESRVITVPVAPFNTTPTPVSLVSRPDPRTGGVVFTLSATDADGDTLTFISPVESDGGGIVEAGATTVANPEDTGDAADDVYSGVFTYTPTAEARFRALDPDFRVDTFTVQARDGHGGIVTFNVEVPIDPPTLGLTETRIDVSTGAALAGALEKTDPTDPSGGRSHLVRGTAAGSLLTNGTFESPGVANGSIGSSVTPTGWTFTGSGGAANVFDPNTAAWGYPTGNDVVYFYETTGPRTLYQDTTATFAAGDIVTLSVDVGNRGGSGANTPLADSTFIAIARTDGTVLAQRDITGADLGPDGTFKTFTISYAMTDADDGDPLRVVLGTGPDATTGAYADFDNAVLTSRSADASNTDELFLGGNYIELGISNIGSFGTRGGRPTGFYGTSRSSRVGLSNDIDGFYNTDPDVDTNSTDDGKDARIDFFLPGSPEERWSIGYNNTEYGGFSALNGASGNSTTLSGTTINDLSDLETGTMSGIFTTTVEDALQVAQVHTFKVNDNYFTTTVTLTNVSGSTLENVQFMRSFDPDNTVYQNGSYQTINRIAAQYTTSGYSMVTGTSLPGDAYQTKTGEQASIFFFSSDPDALVYTGGFSNSNPYSFSGTLQGVGTEFNADQAIGVIFKAGDLNDGDSATFTYVTALTTGDDAANFATLLADAEIAESTPGAVVGKAFILPELDGVVYTASDADGNFEISGDVLKLKDAVSLSRDDSPQTVTVTATKDGISVSKEFTIAVV